MITYRAILKNIEEDILYKSFTRNKIIYNIYENNTKNDGIKIITMFDSKFCAYKNIERYNIMIFDTINDVIINRYSIYCINNFMGKKIHFAAYHKDNLIFKVTAFDTLSVLDKLNKNGIFSKKFKHNSSLYNSAICKNDTNYIIVHTTMDANINKAIYKLPKLHKFPLWNNLETESDTTQTLYTSYFDNYKYFNDKYNNNDLWIFNNIKNEACIQDDEYNVQLTAEIIIDNHTTIYLSMSNISRILNDLLDDKNAKKLYQIILSFYKPIHMFKKSDIANVKKLFNKKTNDFLGKVCTITDDLYATLKHCSNKSICGKNDAKYKYDFHGVKNQADYETLLHYIVYTANHIKIYQYDEVNNNKKYLKYQCNEGVVFYIKNHDDTIIFIKTDRGYFYYDSILSFDNSFYDKTATTINHKFKNHMNAITKLTGIK